MNPLSPEWFVDILVQKPEKMLKPCASVYSCLVQVGGLESEGLCAHSEPVRGVIYPTESVLPGRIFPWLSSLSGLFALATDNMRRDQENQTRLQTPEGLSRCRPVLEWEMLLEEVWVSISNTWPSRSTSLETRASATCPHPVYCCCLQIGTQLRKLWQDVSQYKPLSTRLSNVNSEVCVCV